MDVTITKGFTQKTCKGCGVVFFIPDELESKFKGDGGYWYCPNGHQYRYAEPDDVKYRRLFENEQRARQREAEIAANASESARKLREQLEKLQKKNKRKSANKKGNG